MRVRALFIQIIITTETVTLSKIKNRPEQTGRGGCTSRKHA